MNAAESILSFGPYYGLDYFIAVCVLLAMFLLGSRNRFGFIMYTVAAVSGIVFATMAQSPPLLLTNLVMIVINLRGYFKWNNSRAQAEQLSVRKS